MNQKLQKLQLTDEIATLVMAEIEVLTRRIDGTADRVESQLKTLDRYNDILAGLPKNMEAAATALSVSATVKAKVAIDLALTEAIVNFTPSVAKALETVASSVARRDNLKVWTFAGVIAIGVIIAMGGIIGLVHSTAYSAGKAVGNKEGRMEAQAELTSANAKPATPVHKKPGQ